MSSAESGTLCCRKSTRVSAPTSCWEDDLSHRPQRETPRSSFFFFNDTATTEIYTLSLHDALPISGGPRSRRTADTCAALSGPPRFLGPGGGFSHRSGGRNGRRCLPFACDGPWRISEIGRAHV